MPRIFKLSVRVGEIQDLASMAIGGNIALIGALAGFGTGHTRRGSAR